MQLKEELALIQRDNRIVSEFLHAIKLLVDELALIDHPISNNDLTLRVEQFRPNIQRNSSTNSVF